MSACLIIICGTLSALLQCVQYTSSLDSEVFDNVNICIYLAKYI